MDVGQVVAAMLDETGYCTAEFLREVGVSPTAFADIFSGKIKKGISRRLAKKINARFPEFPIEWIMTGENKPECFDRVEFGAKDFAVLMRRQQEQSARINEILEMEMEILERLRKMENR